MRLKACPNGSRRRSEHPTLPVTPEELAADARAVVARGAGAVHVHVKDDTDADRLDAGRTAVVLDAIRAACPGSPVGVTTGAWSEPTAGARAAAIRSWSVLPDFASVNWHEEGADEVASALLERGIGVEAGLWHLGAVRSWSTSPHRDHCLRILIELPDGLMGAAVRREADSLLDQVRRSSTVYDDSRNLLHGEGSSAWPAIGRAMQLGLSTRIGLEDTLLLPDGTLAQGNDDLVEAVLKMAAPDHQPWPARHG